MGTAMFYHLTDSRLEVALPQLIERARSAGWQVAVRGPDAAGLDALDAALWLGADDGFLPHGRAGGAHDADQPVLLCTPDQAMANTAACLMAVQGGDVTAGEVETLERVCVLFDGENGAELSAARAQWKRLVDEGCAAQYWAQEGGRWVKKAEAGV